MARAFKRLYPDSVLEGFAPDSAWVDFADGWGQRVYPLSQEAKAWIRAFDHGEPVQPGLLHLFSL